jgi:methyltransferase OMS1
LLVARNKYGIGHIITVRRETSYLSHTTKKTKPVASKTIMSFIIKVLFFVWMCDGAYAALQSNPPQARFNSILIGPCDDSISTNISRRTILTAILGSLTPFLASSPKSSSAKASISSDDLRKIYDEGASTYESLYSDSIVSRTLDFPTLRANLVSKASGDVLELGIGTGLNLPYYSNLSENSSPVTSYTALDLSPKMMELAQEKFANGVPNVAPSLDTLYKHNKVDFRIGDVNILSSLFDGKKFDTIIDTFGLCVFPEPLTALKQARELLTPTGKILLLEHQDSVIGKALNPTRNIADVISTCRYDDDVLGLLRSAGFKNISYKGFAGGFLLEVIAS